VHPKPIHQLTAQDLRHHALWEYASGDEGEFDETYVCPTEGGAVPTTDAFAIYHVACRITTVLGNRLTGFMSICGGELDDPAPTVVGEAGGYFPLDYPPTRKDVASFQAVLGAPYAEIFPVRWELALPIAGESAIRSGTFGVAG
jgi:hypothetical protein